MWRACLLPPLWCVEVPVGGTWREVPSGHPLSAWVVRQLSNIAFAVLLCGDRKCWRELHALELNLHMT